MADEEPNALADTGVLEWLDLARGSVALPAPFLKLIASWEAFNRTYRQIWPDSRELPDHHVPGKVAQWQPAVEIWDVLRQDQLYRSKLEALRNLGKVQDVPPSKRPPSEIADPNDLKQVLCHIYRIRCNLFHGGKRISDQNDRQLTDAASAVLLPFVEQICADPNQGLASDG